MQNILLLFARFGSLITFLVLTTLSFVLIVNYNKSQSDIFINSSNYYANKLDAKTSNWERYLTLQEVNDSLLQHNADLLEKFINVRTVEELEKDSSGKFELLPANIIRKTFNLRNNHITLDVGRRQGVKHDMAVLAEDGIIGIVREVSDDFSHVISVLNSQTRISSTVRPYAYPGNLIWKNFDPNHMTLESIPKHVDIAVGDTVTTNGYSTIFPINIDIGTIAAFTTERGSSNYNIKVKLFNNIPNAKTGYVIINRLAEQQLELENLEDE